MSFECSTNRAPETVHESFTPSINFFDFDQVPYSPAIDFLITKDLEPLSLIQHESNEVDYFLGMDPLDENELKIDEDLQLSIESKKLMKKNRYNTMKRKLWSSAEKQELMKLAEQVNREGKFSFARLGELYSKLHPERTAEAARSCAKLLIRHGQYVFENQELNELNLQWTEQEKNQLLKMANEMEKDNKFNFEVLAQLYSKKYPPRSPDAVLLYAQKLFPERVIHLERRKHVAWSEKEKQQLIEMAEELDKNDELSFKLLSERYSAKYPERSSSSTFRYAQRRATAGDIFVNRKRKDSDAEEDDNIWISN